MPPIVLDITARFGGLLQGHIQKTDFDRTVPMRLMLVAFAIFVVVMADRIVRSENYRAMRAS